MMRQIDLHALVIDRDEGGNAQVVEAVHPVRAVQPSAEGHRHSGVDI